MINKKVIFFDLGNTLIFRKKTHQEYDKILLKNFFPKINEIEINHQIAKVSHFYPGLYLANKDNQKISNLDKEKKYIKSAFKKIYELLHLDESNLDDFIHKREKQKRYYMYSGVLNLLKTLTKNNFRLGILTNGRPSRRLVLKQLNIYSYFEEKMLIISDEKQLSKPQKDIFLLAQKISKVSPKNIIYIDDEQKNIIQANKLGFRAFKTTESNINEIKKFCFS